MNAWLGNKIDRELGDLLRIVTRARAVNMLLRIGIPGIGVVESNLRESPRTLIYNMIGMCSMNCPPTLQ